MSKLNFNYLNSFFLFFNNLIYGKQIEYNTKTYLENEIWSPTSINLHKISKESNILDWKISKLEKNPYLHLIFYLKFLTLISILIWLILFLLDGFIIYTIRFILIPYMIFPSIIFLSYLYFLKIDIVKLSVAKKNNFIYDPSKHYVSADILSSKYSKILGYGNRRYLEDQFYGITKIKHSLIEKFNEIKFYSCIYTYEVDSGGGKNRHTAKHTNSVFAFKLNKKINTSFMLYPETIFSKAGNFFTKKEINVESIKFNETFAFSYNGTKNEKALEIVNMISPKVQELLLSLNKSQKGMSILFQDDVMLIKFKGNIFKNLKSHIFFRYNLSKEDLTKIDNLITDFIKIYSELSIYIK